MNVGPLNVINETAYNGHKTRCWQQQRRHNIDGLRPKEVTTKWINIFISLSLFTLRAHIPSKWSATHGPTNANNSWNLKTYFSAAFHAENKTFWTSMPSQTCVCVCAPAISLLPFSALLITITMRRRRQCILMRKLFGDDVEVAGDNMRLVIFVKIIKWTGALVAKSFRIS